MKKPQQTLKAILNENPNHPKIKETLKLMCEMRQKATYHANISSNETYLQVRGLLNSDQDQFNYIHKMLHSRIVGVMGKIKREQIQVRDRYNQARESRLKKQKQQNEVDEEIIAEVEHVINNLDLPISLFKRDDKYWYPQNPKTIEAKDYVHQRIKLDKQRKKAVRDIEKKRKQQKQKMHQEQMQAQRKMAQARKQQIRLHLQNKLSTIDRSKEERKRIISESQKFGSALKPLYKKIQEEEHQEKFSALQEHKKRLSELRKLHQSVDMEQLQERKMKLDEMKRNKQQVKIFDEPVKVYKSKYYTSMTSRSRASEYETNKSMYDKKKQYGEIVRKQFKPDIDPDLVMEMEERLKVMKRRRVRKNPKPKKQKRDSDDQDDSDEDDPGQSKVKSQAPKNILDDSMEDYDSEEDDKPPKRIRGEDEDPDHAQRYEIGVQYLEYVRNLPKKREDKTISKFPEQIEQQQKKSRYEKSNTGHNTKFYKDYLRQLSKTNRNTIDHIDVSRIHKQANKTNLQKNYQTKAFLENQTRVIQEKVKNQEQLLKFKKMKNQDALEKRAEIDGAMIEAIKARLAMMG